MLSAPLSAQSNALFGGYVTDPGTPQSFRVNDEHVICNPKQTEHALLKDGKGGHTTIECPQRSLGEQVTLYGSREKKSKDVLATRIETDAAVDLAVSGYALIDEVVAPLNNGGMRVRADGYVLAITPTTKIGGPANNASVLTSVGSDTWLRYAGTLHPDGSVSATSVEFTPNQIQKSENKLRQKTEFDADAVTEDKRQGAVSRAFLGWDMKRLPAYKDEAMQKRISELGNRLIPAYQRNLPEDASTKIHFRFQLVDEKKLKRASGLTSGIVLVPYQIVSALQNDNQVAAVLGDGIAVVLEKQALRSIPTANKIAAANLAGTVGAFFVPGLGLATSLAGGKAQSIAEHHQMEQSSRETLSWMRDAGFDIREAPVAWWLLEKSEKKTLAQTRLPYRTQYLYELLGTRWRTELAVKP